MSEFWSKMGAEISGFFVWSIDNHPGKLIGTSIGLVMGFLMVTLGFWRTLVLILFATLGFVIGKRQDDNKAVTAWLERTIKKY